MWKSYIDFEIAAEEYDNVRDLYDTLLNRTNHIKVWISLADFELGLGGENGMEAARKVYERANKALENSDKEERLMLLEAWLEAEKNNGDESEIKRFVLFPSWWESCFRVDGLMPRRIKRRRQLHTDDGVDAGWEEYFDYIFPSDQAAKGANKLFAAALRWKSQMAAGGTEDGDASTVKQEEEDEEEKAKQKNREGLYLEPYVISTSCGHWFDRLTLIF